jgi:hypothetical protein
MIFHRSMIASIALAGLAPLLQGAAALTEEPYGDNVYVNCPYRFAALFPSPPAIRDFTFTALGRNAPARQFSATRGGDMFSVIIADFTNGPAADEAIVEAAAIPLREKGAIKYQFKETYDPGIPGRQINAAMPGGRQYRASVYMADHRLYITEATAAEGDFFALQFEQSISIIDANGTDLDKNGAFPSRKYECGR